MGKYAAVFVQPALLMTVAYQFFFKQYFSKPYFIKRDFNLSLLKHQSNEGNKQFKKWMVGKELSPRYMNIYPLLGCLSINELLTLLNLYSLLHLLFSTSFTVMDQNLLIVGWLSTWKKWFTAKVIFWTLVWWMISK